MAYISKHSIEDFKSALVNGGVRPTMFSVEIDFPDIVLANAGFGNQSELKERAKFLVKASQMPGSQIGVVNVPFRGRQLKVSGDRTFADWETTILNDTDFKLRIVMEKWAELIQNHNFALGHEVTDRGTDGGNGSKSGYFGTATVRQLDRQGEQLRMYEFNGIWPTNIDQINLNFGDTDTVEEYNVTFAVQYWHAGGKNNEGGQKTGGGSGGDGSNGPTLVTKGIQS